MNVLIRTRLFLYPTFLLLGLLTPTLGFSQGAVDVTAFGAVGDGVTDDTAAFQAAWEQMSIHPGKLTIPPGKYKISSTLLLSHPLEAGGAIRRIEFDCIGGFATTSFVWYGDDMAPMFQVPAGPVTIRNCGFSGSDPTHRPIAVLLSGGAYHYIEGNSFNDWVYEGIRAYQTWSGHIDDNRFMNCDTYGGAPSNNAAIHFGPGGLGPVNDTRVMGNHLDCYGRYGILNDSNGSGGSQQNYYAFNTIEGTSPGTIADVQLIDNRSYWYGQFWEVAGSTQSNYATFVINGTGNQFQFQAIGCWIVNGSYNIFYGNPAGHGMCGAPNDKYSIIAAGGFNTFYGADHGDCTGSGCVGSKFFSGYAEGLSVGALRAYRQMPASEMDWANGRVDLASGPITSSQSTQANPNRPTQFGAAATVPLGTIVVNSYAGPYAFGYDPQDANLLWVCTANPCSTNPGNPDQWAKTAFLSSRVRFEGTAAPNKGTWRAGDFFWNITPTANGMLGWMCTTGGTPGIWTAVPISSGGVSAGVVKPAGGSGDLQINDGAGGLGFLSQSTFLSASAIDPTPALGASDTKVPSQNAVKQYVDSQFAEKRNLPGFRFLDLGEQITPVFDATGADVFQITLKQDISISTLLNATAGQTLTFLICQDTTGGHSFRWPADFSGGMTIQYLSPTATRSTCAVQSFIYNGTVAYAVGPGSMNQHVTVVSQIKRPMRPSQPQPPKAQR